MSERGTQSRSGVDPGRSHKVIVAPQPPTLLLLSGDSSLVKLVREASAAPWRVEQYQSTLGERDLFARPNVRLVVVDDEVVEEGERGWLLGQIRLRTRGAPLMYVASSHDLENEKRARASGAHYYTSKPLDENQFVQVLQSFLKARK